MAGSGAGAACGTCAICLQDLQPSEEAFLDACLHHFHLHCVRRWVAAQREGSEGRQAAAALACPLCRRPFESVIFDCDGGAYRREYFKPGGAHHRAARPGSGSGSLALTAAHRRRRAAYALPLPPGELAARTARVAALTRQQAQRAAVSEFVIRELQALLLQEDVQLVAQHVLGTLGNALATAAGPAHVAGSASLGAAPRQRQQRGLQPRRPLAGPPIAPKASAAPAPASAAAAGSNSAVQPPLPELVQRVRAAAAPFVFERAERFAWEVAAFSAAGTATVAAYDRLSLQLDAAAAAAEGAAARRQLGQQRGQAGLRSESRSGSGSPHRAALFGGGSSSDEEEEARRRQASPEIQRSDSEGYLELLLQQGQAARRRQGPASPPTQQQDRQCDSAGQCQAAGNGQAPSGRQLHGSRSRGVTRSRGRSPSCSGRGRHGGAEGRSGSRRRHRGSGRDDGEKRGTGRRARRRSSSTTSTSTSTSSGLGSRGRGASAGRGRQHLRRRRRQRQSSSPGKGSPWERFEPGSVHTAAELAEGSHAKGSGSSPDRRMVSSSVGGGDGGSAARSAGCQAGPELAALRQQALRALLEHRQRSQCGAAGAGQGPEQQDS